MRYLIQQWIKTLRENEQCPRLMIDATQSGVVVPEHIKSRWGEAMPIDLDPTYPLELEMTEAGVDCCLSFGGPYECHFPWASIYVVQDRDSQIGMVIEEHLPTNFLLSKDPPGENADRNQVTLKPIPNTPSQPFRLVDGDAPVAAPDLEIATDDANTPAATAPPRLELIKGGKG